MESEFSKEFITGRQQQEPISGIATIHGSNAMRDTPNLDPPPLPSEVQYYFKSIITADVKQERTQRRRSKVQAYIPEKYHPIKIKPKSSFQQKYGNKAPTTVKDSVQEFATSAGFHGIGIWLNRENNCLYRALYLIIWLVFLGYCIVLIRRNVSRYLEYNIKVSFEEEIQLSLELPSITICPTHTYRKSKVGGDKIFLDMFLAPARPDINVTETCFDPSIPAPTNPPIYAPEYYDYGRNVRWAADQIWLSFQDLFVECEVLGVKKNCSELFFGHYTTSGRCFTFNYQGEFSSSPSSLVWNYMEGHEHHQKFVVGRNGLANSVRFQLNWLKDEFCLGEIDDKIGFRLLIHDRYVLPTFMDGNILLTPGHSYEIGVEAKTIDKELVEGLGKCRDQFDLPLFGHVPYTKENCVLQCWAENVFQQCQCLLRYVALDNANTEEVSSADFLMRHNLNAVKGKTGYTTDAQIRENIVEVSVFYKSMAVTRVIEDWDFRLFDLISNLGGTLGLFLGASLFSLVEIIEFLAKLCIRTCHKKKK